MTSLKRNWHVAAFLATVVAVSGCGGGGGSSSSSGSGSGGGAPLPVTNPSTAPTSGPVDAAAYVCPTSDSDAASARRAIAQRGLVRRLPLGHRTMVAATPSLIAVTYNRATLRSARTSFALSEARAGGLFKREFDFPHIGLTTRILAVAPQRAASIEATLRAQPGVRSVGIAGARRYPLAVTSPDLTNDPYFAGFPNPIPTPVGDSGNSGTAVPPATNDAPPYYENASVPGQWNLHATRLEDAFGYSVAGNGTAYSPNALGSSSVKIAIIDSGADTSQPDLGPKIAYQRCFITSADGTTQSTSDYVTDPDGHGTDVSALAGVATNNGLGFTAAGGNSSLYEYRVDPTPDDTCLPGATPPADAQCGAMDLDIISAVGDAVQSGVNVINLSLGATQSTTEGGCTSSGVDADGPEQNAINDALAANVIVVAASGNDKNLQDAPGCDSGVIAAGASALADGSLNGLGNSGGSPSAPIEYVASYSSYGSPGAAFRNAGAWGIVAPGGDPNTVKSGDYDYLHWVYDLYTSTPYGPKDDGNCGLNDYPYNVTTAKSCTILIAGTSMASPTVAGAAALILAVNRAYQNPTRMKQLLCSTTDDINDAREGCGRLNVYRAMAVAIGDPTPP